MGKVDCLRTTVYIELNLLLPCFGLTALYLSTPDPARQPIASLYTAVHKACSYMVTVGSILKAEVPPPLFLSRFIIFPTLALSL